MFSLCSVVLSDQFTAVVYEDDSHGRHRLGAASAAVHLEIRVQLWSQFEAGNQTSRWDESVTAEQQQVITCDFLCCDVSVNCQN